jgi:outer membrane immunogenic protein
VKKSLCVAVASVALLANATAQARDVALTPAQSWSGVYVGVHGGFLSGKNNLADLGLVKPDGAFGGIQAGYWTPLSPHWLLGFEADLSLSDADGLDGVSGISSRISAFGTARTRVGYASGSWLVFASGGFAWGRLTSNDVPSTLFPLNMKQNFTGWSAGVGAEYAIAPRWSAKVEYIFADLGRNDENFFGTVTPQDLSFGSIRLGLNYRLGAMPAATGAVQRTVYSWSGAYIGIHGGNARGNQSMTYLGGTVDFEPKGNFFGVQSGYNWHLPSNLVLGIESDISFASIDGSFLGGCCTTRTERFGTVRLRTGYAFSNILFYATGGLAWATPQNNYFFSVTTSDRPFVGWTAGAGIEYALSARWSIRGEYLRFNFENNSSDYGGVSPFIERAEYDIFRVGLNYRASLFDIIAGR